MVSARTGGDARAKMAKRRVLGFRPHEARAPDGSGSAAAAPSRGGTAPGVVDDVNDNTLDVTMALSVVLSGGTGWVGVGRHSATGSRRELARRKNAHAGR